MCKLEIVCSVYFNNMSSILVNGLFEFSDCHSLGLQTGLPRKHPDPIGSLQFENGLPVRVQVEGTRLQLERVFCERLSGHHLCKPRR